MNHQHNLTQISAGNRGDEAVAVVRGKGTFQVSQPLKSFGMEAAERGLHHLLIDLEQCSTMDSTFMGVLAMIARLGRKKAMRVKLLNTGGKALKQLRGLGIARMFDFDHRHVSKEGLEPITGAGPPTPLQLGRTTLQAHEALVEGNPENETRFRGVIEAIRGDLDSFTRDKTGTDGKS